MNVLPDDLINPGASARPTQHGFSKNAASYNQCRLIKCILIAQPIQPTMYHRPYTANYDGNVQEAVDRLMGKVTSITPGVGPENPFSRAGLSEVSSNLLKIQTTAGRQLNIDGGWDTQRFCVSMLFETNGITGSTYELVTGYTDHLGATQTGLLDPNMIIYVNNYIKYAKSNTVGGRGAQYTKMCNDQILRADLTHNTTTSLRPCDTFNVLSSTGLYDHGDVDGIVDTRYTIAPTGSFVSQRTNGIPSSYMKRTVDAYSNSVSDLSEYDTEYGSMAYVNAADAVVETAAHEFNLFTFLQQQYEGTVNANKVNDNRSFPISMITGLWPDNNDGVYIINLPQRGSIIDAAANSEHMNTTSIEATMAATLSSIVPAVLTQYGFIKAGFVLSNENVTGEPEFCYANDTLTPQFEEITSPYAHEYLRTGLESEILACLRAQNIIQYSLTVYANVLGNINMQISLNGGQSVPFNPPCFCDSITSPIKADSMGHNRTFAGDINAVLGTVCPSTLTNHGY